MGSKYQLNSIDIYYKNSSVAKNKLHITNEKEIQYLEEKLIKEAYIVFSKELNKDTIFDESYFKMLHKRTLSSLYEWAGKYRDFNMAKGESRFCQGEFVASSSKKIFDDLAKDNYLKNFYDKPKEEFAKKLAYYKCEINALHPFYEHNGRIMRLFFDMIAIYNGYQPIDYSKVSPKEYIDCAIDCVLYADESGFYNIILQGLKRARVS